MEKTQICRLCLAKTNKNYFSRENNVVIMIDAILSDQDITNAMDVLCLKCLLNLKLVYRIQQKMKQTARLYQEYIAVQQKASTVKIETVLIDDAGNIHVDDDVSVKVEIFNAENPCIICARQIESNCVNSHMQEHMNVAQTCEDCGSIFKTIELFHKHLITKHSLKMYRCPKCHLQFQYKSFYDMHLQRVCPTVGIRAVVPHKEIISKIDEQSMLNLGVYKARSEFKQSESPRMKALTCEICAKVFKSKNSLSQHSHKTKTCPLCNKILSKQAYNRHMSNHKFGPQVCHICGAKLQNHSSLRHHLFYSHDNAGYKCEDCGLTFQKKCRLVCHRQKEHIGEHTHMCDTCGKGFYSKAFLQRHVNMKHLKLRPHICQFCNRGFSSPYALKTHARQHTNETPYKCEQCGEAFRQNVSLKTHRKSKHNIEEPIICNCKVCGKGFCSNAALCSHMRLH